GSTYPLTEANQRWSYPEEQEHAHPAGKEHDERYIKRRIFFPTQTAQGCYNAALVLLDRPRQMVEYAPPQFRAGAKANRPSPSRNNFIASSTILLQEQPFAAAACSSYFLTKPSLARPPIWVSMVAPSGRLVPLQFFTEYGDPDELVYRRKVEDIPSSDEPARLLFPGFTFAALMGVCLFAGWVVYLALRPGSARLFWKSKDPRVAPEPNRWEPVYGAICFTALAILLAPIALLGALYLPGVGPPENTLLRWLLSVVIAALFLLPLLVTATTLLWTLLAAPSWGLSQWLRQWVAPGGAAAVLALFGLALRLLLSSSLAWLASGVFEDFPVLPLLATFAALLWVFLAVLTWRRREQLRRWLEKVRVPLRADVVWVLLLLVVPFGLPVLLLLLLSLDGGTFTASPWGVLFFHRALD